MKYHIPHSSRKPSLRIPLLAWGLIAILFLMLLAALLPTALRRNRPAPEAGQPEAAAVVPAEPEAVPALRGLILPTPQTHLFEPGWQQGVQPTASGKPESGLYGSVRTDSRGLASFHEGVDIAAVARDARGYPADPVHAVADGRVAYASRSPGNSNYGNYVILLHDDPAGEIYTLYAHLAAIEPAVQPGAAIRRGDPIGREGNTSSSPIPRERGHLHLEIGMLANDRFPEWARKEGLKDPHGRYNGRNLLGVDPLGVLAHSGRDPQFSMLTHLESLPVAFRLAVKANGRMPDYFRRHRALWKDAAGPGPVIVLDCSEGGVPLAGRNATAEESARAGSSAAVVLMADETVLGRNGRRLVVRQKGEWTLGRNGESWLGLLLF